MRWGELCALVLLLVIVWALMMMSMVVPVVMMMIALCSEEAATSVGWILTESMASMCVCFFCCSFISGCGQQWTTGFCLPSFLLCWCCQKMCVIFIFLPLFFAVCFSPFSQQCKYNSIKLWQRVHSASALCVLSICLAICSARCTPV